MKLSVKPLVDRSFGQTDQGQRWQPIGQMRLDRNGRGLDADLGAAVNNRQSHDSFLEFAKKLMVRESEARGRHGMDTGC